MVAAIWSKVVLPAPFGPIRIQRSSPCTVQSTLRRRTAASRLTSTPRSRSTSSDTRTPSSARHPWIRRLEWPPRPNLCHCAPGSPPGPTDWSRQFPRGSFPAVQGPSPGTDSRLVR